MGKTAALFDVGDGQLRTAAEIAETFSLHITTVYKKISRGLLGTLLALPLDRRLDIHPRAKLYDVGDGQLRTVTEITTAFGINRNTLLSRIYRGRPLIQPTRRSGGRSPARFDVGEETDEKNLTVPEISRRFGISRAAIYSRIADGARGKDILATRISVRRASNNPRARRIDVGDGLKLTIKEITDRFGIHPMTLYSRIAKHPDATDHEILHGKQRPLLEADGRRLSEQEWADYLDISVSRLRLKIRQGSLDEIVWKHEHPIRRGQRLTVDGVSRTIQEWTQLLTGKKECALIYKRLYAGFSPRDAVYGRSGRYHGPVGCHRHEDQVAIARLYETGDLLCNNCFVLAQSDSVRCVALPDAETLAEWAARDRRSARNRQAARTEEALAGIDHKALEQLFNEHPFNQE